MTLAKIIWSFTFPRAPCEEIARAKEAAARLLCETEVSYGSPLGRMTELFSLLMDSEWT